MCYKILYDATDSFEDIIKLDKEFFEDKYLWTAEHQKELFDKNKESFVLVKKDDKVIGYLNYLCITKQKYEEMMNSNVIVDDFDVKDIEEYNKNENYITINSVVIEMDNQDKEVIKILNNEFLKKLKELKNNEIKINGINGIAISNDGRKYFERLGFNQIKELEDNNYLYELKENYIETIENKLYN